MPEASSAGDLERRTSFLTRIVPPAADASERRGGPAVPRDVADLARRLPLERKVAQLFLVGFAGQDLTPPSSASCAGSTWAGSCSPPPNYSTPRSWRRWPARRA